MADNATFLCIHLLPTSVGDIHASTRPQVLQGPHHKVYVIPHFTHIPHGVPHAHRCHSYLPHSTTKAAALLVCNILLTGTRFLVRMFVLIRGRTCLESCMISVHSDGISTSDCHETWTDKSHYYIFNSSVVKFGDSVEGLATFCYILKLILNIYILNRWTKIGH
jgi:hypothetical protein